MLVRRRGHRPPTILLVRPLVVCRTASLPVQTASFVVVPTVSTHLVRNTVTFPTVKLVCPPEILWMVSSTLFIAGARPI